MKIPKESARAHIVFDNDGTMIDSLSNFYDLVVEILSVHLERELSLDEVKEAYVPDWNQLLINLGVSEPSEELIQVIIDDLNDTNKDYIPPIIEGTKEFIEKLHRANMSTYVWTGRDEFSGMKVFDALGLTNLFSEMQFRDTSRAKPDPEGLEIMLGSIDKDKILLIGDSIVDIKGAKAFGISCLIVDWFDGDDHKELLEAGASAVVSTHEDALSFILDNFN